MPTTEGYPETNYSCVATDNCDYEVYVIANYRSSKGQWWYMLVSGILVNLWVGDIYVNLTVNGQSSRPLILVFVSSQPVKWILTVSGEVEINRVIVVSSGCSNA